LISNAWSGLRDFFIRNRIEAAFDLLVISAEVGLMKPDARIYRLALEKSASLAEESVFIDDLPANVEGARAVGMTGIQFKTSGQTLEELSRLLAK
jgi:putative hydrolase of the HAD superfamily